MLKWVGLVGCGVIVVAWIVSFRQSVLWMPVRPVLIGLAPCGISMQRLPGDAEFPPGPMLCNSFSMRWWPELRTFENTRLSAIDRIRRRAPYWNWSLFVPFWCILIPLAVPTAGLWYLDRKPPPGCCPNCGYDLTGNVSGICPECGVPI